MSETRPPVTPLVLGLAGLVPFIVLTGVIMTKTVLPVLGSVAAAKFALLIYAIVVLSFLGGVRWGIALAAEDQAKVSRDYIIGVVPVLICWTAVVMSAPRYFWMLCIAYIVMGLLDYGLACRTMAPE